jgi:hypothetical protein
LKNHAHPPAQVNHIHPGSINIRIIQKKPTFHPGPGDEIVHPVYAPEICALPAPGRTYERGNFPFPHFHADTVQGMKSGIVKIQVLGPKLYIFAHD